MEKINSEEIEIVPFSKKSLDPVSYELHLGEEIQKITPLDKESFSGKNPKEKDITLLKIEESGYTLYPGEFIVAKTAEKIIIGKNTLGMFDGKASLAQIGLFTHTSSMLIEPGFEGHITCEIFNGNKYPIILFPNQKIGQVVFAMVS